MPELVLKKMKGQPTSQSDPEQRTRVWVMTTGDTDRDGETVDPTGGDFSEYRLNPTIQWNHDTDSEPIGQMVGLPWNDYVGEGTQYPEIVGPKRMALLGRIKFSRANPKAEQIWRQVEEGTVKGGSISFVPTGQTKKNGSGGNHYPSWKLLEMTLCSVGSNFSAVATSKKCLNCAAKKACDCRVHHLTLPQQKTANSMLVSAYNTHPDHWDMDKIKQTIGGMSSADVNDTWHAIGMVGSATRAKLLQTFANVAGMAWRAGAGERDPFKRSLSGLDKMYEGSKTYKEGFTAADGGQSASENPYTPGGHAWKAWQEGWTAASRTQHMRRSLSGGEIHRLNKRGDRNVKKGSLAGATITPSDRVKIQGLSQEIGMTYAQTQKLVEDQFREGRADDANEAIMRVREAYKSFERSRKAMKRKAWVKGKSLWVLKSEGPVADGSGLTGEMKDYLQMRGLDEVQLEKEEPPPDAGYAPVEMADAPPMPMDDPSMMPKAEDIADDVATRAADLTSTGMANEPAVDMAMEEDGLPKSVRAAVKHLALQRMKGKKADDDDNKSKTDDDDKDKKKSVAAGKLVRTKRGNLCVVKSVEGKTARVVKVNGDEEEVKAKELKTIKKSGDWGLPSKITNWGDMQAKLTNWYGNLVGMVKGLPALKDADLTGEEQKDVEDAVDEAFMKAADDLDLKGFMAQPAPPAQKTSDSIVPQDDLPGTNTPDMSLAIGSNASADSAGNDLSTVPQGKLPNSNPGKAYPRKELKAYAKHVAVKVAKSHPPKLQRTIAKRAAKFIVKYVAKAAPENVSPAMACTKLKDDNGELTSVERGMLGAACARGNKKLSKKFPGGCGKSPKCRKGWLCKKCCKKVLRKADGAGMTNATVESPPPLGTTAGVQVRATPDGQFETWNTSTGQCVDGPFPSYDGAAEAMSKHLRRKADDDDKEKAATSGGTMDPSPKPADNIEGSPTGGGTMELKADDDDDKVTKRGRKLLTKDADAEEEEKFLKGLQFQLENAKSAIDGLGRKIYQQTAVRV